MEPIGVIIGIIVVIAIILAAAASTNTNSSPCNAEKKCCHGKRPWEDYNNGDLELGLNAPLFAKEDGLVATLAAGQEITVFGPAGVLTMRVAWNNSEKAVLRNDDYEALAVFDWQFMSEEISQRTNRPRGAWRLKDLRRKGTDWYSTGRSDITYSEQVRDNNRLYMRDYLDDGWDFLDTLVMIDLMYSIGGFNHPISQIVADHAIAEEAPVESVGEQPPADEPPAETVSEENYSNMETKEVSSSPPAPESPETETRYSDSDSGSSYDSGGDSGGGGFDD